MPSTLLSQHTHSEFKSSPCPARCSYCCNLVVLLPLYLLLLLLLRLQEGTNQRLLLHAVPRPMLLWVQWLLLLVVDLLPTRAVGFAVAPAAGSAGRQYARPPPCRARCLMLLVVAVEVIPTQADPLASASAAGRRHREYPHTVSCRFRAVWIVTGAEGALHPMLWTVALLQWQRMVATIQLLFHW